MRIQVDNAYKWLWTNDQARDTFSQFLSAVSGVRFENIDQGKTVARKMIIWPKSPSSKEATSVQAAREEGFLIVDFDLDNIFSCKIV